MGAMDGDWRADVDVAVAAAIAAGRATMRVFGGHMEVRHKGPDQPLTPSDLEADHILRERLLAARPGYGWLSEETKDDPERLRRARVWIVDPIDGTRSFIAARREFAVSVGLSQGGEAVVGVVLNPATGELYACWRGGGAWKLEGALAEDGPGAPPGGSGPTAPAAGASVPPGAAPAGTVGEASGRAPRVPEEASSPATSSSWRRLHVREQPTDTPTILASRSEIREGEFHPFAGWQLHPMGSTAFKLALLAEGVGDIFLSRGPKSEWDVCGGGLLVQEAGGVATDLHGEALTYNRRDPRVYGILAAPRWLHATALERVRALPPPARLARRAEDPLHPGLEEGDE